MSYANSVLSLGFLFLLVKTVCFLAHKILVERQEKIHVLS